MTDFIITGASRGIGRALALAVRPTGRLLLVARDPARLASVVAEVAARGGQALAVPGDLGSLAGARALGRTLAELAASGTTLVHNAGLWPAALARSPEGYESAFVVNHLGPLAMQRSLLASGKLRRILAISAGLMVKGRFDAARTPAGGDFSALRTYCTSKLCFALAMRDIAAAHPELDVLILHPGVVKTELGARPGLLGALLSLVKRGWESPEVCAARLARVLGRERWSLPGEARWQFEEQAQPWPPAAEDAATRQAVRETTAKLLDAAP